MKAVDLITDAYVRCNRLSPGESVSGDDLDFAFARLNILADELSAKSQFIYHEFIVSAAQTGHITLGAGAWASIAPGIMVDSVTANGFPISPISITQYNAIFDLTTQGQPQYYAQDGFSTIFLWPVATGQTMRLQSSNSVSAFADLTTNYTLPPGYAAYLGAALAVRIAPNIIGKLPPELVRAELSCAKALTTVTPPIVNVTSYTGGTVGGTGILNGWR